MPSGFRKIHPRDEEAPKAEPKKGRGAVSNPAGRFEPNTRAEFDDGWNQVADADWTPPPLRTNVTEDKSRSVICRNDSPDIGFGSSINPYRGCEHGCIYCFARPSHGYFGLSTGLDFESKLFAKSDADKLLRKELANPRYVCDGGIAMGTNTDPYQPIERERQITRKILAVLSECGHPVSIVTKSALILRDIDILAPMAKRGLACAFVSVTTLDRNLARRMEPRAATPEKRLAAIRALNEAGVPAGIMVAPVIPGLTDHEIEPILEKAAEAKAQTAGFTIIRLPYEIKDLFREWLHTHVPLRASHVETLIREVRSGRLNDPNFGSRMRGTGPYAEMIAKRFRLARERFGIPKRGPTLDTSQFKHPAKDSAQLSLL
jgi:DNA repair photolyase